MDILGNMSSIDKKHSGTSAAETRTHSATNELTGRTITNQTPKKWVDDAFTDNDTTLYDVLDVATGGDGTWSAGSDKGTCSTVVTVTGSPSGSGSILGVNGYYQDVKLSADITVTSGDAGFVFGYRDKDNYWVVTIVGTTSTKLYEVSAGTWNLRATGLGISAGSQACSLEMHSGSVTNIVLGNKRISDYDATIPAGAVGFWSAAGGGANTFDNFVETSRAARNSQK